MNNTIMTIGLKALSTFFPPNKPITFTGEHSSLRLAEFMVNNGLLSPLLVVSDFLHQQGQLDNIIDIFTSAGGKVTLFKDIKPNPTLDNVEAGLSLSLDKRCDSVLAIGGGSVIDTAKVIAAASTNDKALSKLVGVLKVKTPPLPFYVVPTTSGTGSEVTTVSVISNPDTHKKLFFVDPKYIALATALDPLLIKSLPPAMTAATGMDALTHAIEAYTSRNHFDDSSRDAATAIRLLIRYLPRAYENGDDLEARENVALASFLAGYAFTKASLGYVHAISHQLSAHYDTAHGLTNAVILPRVLRFNQSACQRQYAALEAMFGKQLTPQSDAQLAQQFIQRIDRLSDSLAIPLKMDAIQSSDIEAISQAALSEARFSYAVPKVMTAQHIADIVSSARIGQRDIQFAA